MVRVLLVVIAATWAWWAPATARAQSQKAMVCGGGCGGGCGPCAGDGNGGGGNQQPAQPSAWIRNREQILEGRGVKAYDRCVAELAKQRFDDAIDDCKTAVGRYGDAFGSGSARGREAAQALAAAENARAAELFHRGKCDEAASLFRAAAEQDPTNGAYGRNAMLFTASACAAVATTHRAPAPPPPPSRTASASPVSLPTIGPLVSPEAWQKARAGFHEASNQAAGIAMTATASAVPGGELGAQVVEAAEMRKSYNQLARDLVDEATGAANETASILGGGSGDSEHVLATPERMARMVNQYVSDQIVDTIVKKTGAWLIGHGLP